MIISHRYQFIFIKTNKTAGTSIEIALSKLCGPDDIITPISPEDEKIRSALGYRGPQNYLAPARDYKIGDVFRLIFARKRKQRFYNHISAEIVKECIGEDVWDSYYKFCFERNPWDRLISFYYWRCPSDATRPDISTYIRSNDVQLLKQRGYNLYTIDGKVVVDRIYKFEHILTELEHVCQQLGFPEKLILPRTKSKSRKNRQSYHKFLSVEDKAKIAEIFSEEISLLGYEL